MSIGLSDYSSNLRKRLLGMYISNELLDVNQNSHHKVIFDSIKFCISDELNEYWSCIFLLFCEEKGPVITIFLEIDKFHEYFEFSLKSISLNPDLKIMAAYSSCIDGFLVNELLRLDELQTLDFVIEILGILHPFQHMLSFENSTFKARAEISMCTIWKNISEFTQVDHPSKDIIVVTWKMIIAFKCGLNVQSMVYSLSESVFEYVHNNLNCKDELTIKYCLEILEYIEEMTKDNQIKMKVYKYQEKMKLQRMGINLSLTKDQLTIYDGPIYSNNKGNVQVYINKGKYLNKDICIKKYIVRKGENFHLTKTYNEIMIYQRLSEMANERNCFLTYYGTIPKINFIMLIMDWYPKNLMESITVRRNQSLRLNEYTFMNIAYKLISSYNLMIQIGILHNDIKPQNILVDEDFSIFKIIDFNVAIMKTEEMTLSKPKIYNIGGTKGYSAPEKEEAARLNDDSLTYNLEKADVYSLGVVLYQLLLLKVENQTHDKMLSEINDCGIYSDKTIELLKKMLEFDPDNRPTFGEAEALIKRIEPTVTY